MGKNAWKECMCLHGVSVYRGIVVALSNSDQVSAVAMCPWDVGRFH